MEAAVQYPNWRQVLPHDGRYSPVHPIPPFSGVELAKFAACSEHNAGVTVTSTDSEYSALRVLMDGQPRYYGALMPVKRAPHRYPTAKPSLVESRERADA